ncbi:MAG: hypothetical protein ACLUNO_03110 [Oscillospiraceae bacterium]
MALHMWRPALLSGNGWYGFGADGKLIMTGFVTGNGKTYYYADGVRAKGLTKIGEDYYFFNAGSGMMYKDANMWVRRQQLRRRARNALLWCRGQDGADRRLIHSASICPRLLPFAELWVDT